MVIMTEHDNNLVNLATETLTEENYCNKNMEC